MVNRLDVNVKGDWVNVTSFKSVVIVAFFLPQVRLWCSNHMLVLIFLLFEIFGHLTFASNMLICFLVETWEAGIFWRSIHRRFIKSFLSELIVIRVMISRSYKVKKSLKKLRSHDRNQLYAIVIGLGWLFGVNERMLAMVILHTAFYEKKCRDKESWKARYQLSLFIAMEVNGLLL